MENAIKNTDFNFDNLNSDVNEKLKTFKVKKLDVKLELNTNTKYNIEKIVGDLSAKGIIMG